MQETSRTKHTKPSCRLSVISTQVMSAPNEHQKREKGSELGQEKANCQFKQIDDKERRKEKGLIKSGDDEVTVST